MITIGREKERDRIERFAITDPENKAFFGVKGIGKSTIFESVFTKKSEPYLKRLADKNTFEALVAMVKEANARRKPNPPALFPPSNLDWHWDLIDLLEKDNQLIKEVRARQKAFGPRAKDLEK